MRALVTGANGLIGSNLCRELLSRGYEVRAMVRASSDTTHLQGLPVERVCGDILLPDSLSAAVSGCEMVFHTASVFSYWGVESAQLEETAVTGVSNMLSAASRAGVKRFVLTSSSVVFGSSTFSRARDETSTPDTAYSPPYCTSKLHQERTAVDLARALGLDLVIVNPCITVGPYDTKLSPSNGLILAYLSDPFRVTFPGGCNIVSVRDVAQGHALAAEKGSSYERYLLGSENMEWSLVHRTIAELSGVPAPRVYANHTASYLAASIQEFWAQATKSRPLTTREQAKMVGEFYWYSSAKAIRDLGYAPRPARSALAEAIADLLASSHVSSSLRRSLAPSREVYQARVVLLKEQA